MRNTIILKTANKLYKIPSLHSILLTQIRLLLAPILLNHAHPLISIYPRCSSFAMSIKDLTLNFRIVTTLFISLSASFALLRLTDSFYHQPQVTYFASFSSSSSHCRMSQNDLWHLQRDDEELMRRAVEVSCASDQDKGERNKVAFMFLTRGRMPLMPLWERFFKGQDEELYSIYIHTSSPEYKEEQLQSSVFFRRRIPSKVVEWGQSSMINAERRLLATALLDPLNRWFILLSESCIPLFNFTRTYMHLAGSHLSFLSSFDDPRKFGRGRYVPRMGPTVTLQDWRKGSQWFAIHRAIAVHVVSDRMYYPVILAHCRPPCYMDEHYLPTLVTKTVPWLNSNRSLTWTDWSRGGSHPVTYRKRDVTVGLVEKIRRGVGCVYKGGSESEVCFLFGRKFHANSLGPLMKLAETFMLY